MYMFNIIVAYLVQFNYSKIAWLNKGLKDSALHCFGSVRDEKLPSR